VLFLHGITESRRYFARAIAPLALRFDLVIPDLPGFGLSPKPATRYSMDLFRDSVRAFLEQHGLHEQPLHLVGHSLGSLIALEYSAAYPEHIERLALLNLPRHFSSEEAHGIFWSGSPSYRKLLLQASARASWVQFRRTGLSMSLRYARRFPWAVLMDARKFTFLSLTSTLENCLINYRVDPVLERMPHVPTLLIHGERDQVAPVANVRSLPGVYPWMRLLEIPGSGHHILHTHGQSVVRAIDGFLSEPVIPGST
jgi:pimeloyl-ACP methyl ester carboxylesterase